MGEWEQKGFLALTPQSKRGFFMGRTRKGKNKEEPQSCHGVLLKFGGCNFCHTQNRNMQWEHLMMENQFTCPLKQYYHTIDNKSI